MLLDSFKGVCRFALPRPRTTPLPQYLVGGPRGAAELPQYRDIGAQAAQQHWRNQQQGWGGDAAFEAVEERGRDSSVTAAQVHRVPGLAHIAQSNGTASQTRQASSDDRAAPLTMPEARDSAPDGVRSVEEQGSKELETASSAAGHVPDDVQGMPRHLSEVRAISGSSSSASSPTKSAVNQDRRGSHGSEAGSRRTTFSSWRRDARGESEEAQASSSQGGMKESVSSPALGGTKAPSSPSAKPAAKDGTASSSKKMAPPPREEPPASLRKPASSALLPSSNASSSTSLPAAAARSSTSPSSMPRAAEWASKALVDGALGQEIDTVTKALQLLKSMDEFLAAEEAGGGLGGPASGGDAFVNAEKP